MRQHVHTTRIVGEFPSRTLPHRTRSLGRSRPRICRLNPFLPPMPKQHVSVQFIAAGSASKDATGSDAPGWNESALLVECDGVLLDIHMEGHRVAFNRALEDLGYSCTQWNPTVYNDLLRLGDGTGTGLIKSYFNMVGWPLMLSTKERPDFVENIYRTKQRIFKEMVMSGNIPLRDGAVELLDDAMADGVKPVILAATASAPEDSAISCAMLNLGPSRASKMQVLQLAPTSTTENVEENMSAGTSPEDLLNQESERGGEDESGPLSFDQRVKMAQSEAKTQAATSFARAINLQNRGVGMMVDPALRAAKERAGMADPAYFAAIVAAMGCQASRSVLVAASHSLSEGAKSAGLFVAGVPPSLAARGGYSAMDVKFDGMGPGGLTWRKLKSLLENRLAQDDSVQE